MKAIVSHYLTLFTVIEMMNISTMFSQDEPLCNMPDVTPQTDVLPIQFGGLYISSSGVLRGLMIFVRFADDNESGPNWSNPDTLPEWAQHFVEPTYEASGDYYPGTVSHYFYENSYGKFHVIGDVYYVRTDSNEAYYHEYAYAHGPSAARGLIETEVFNKLDGPDYDVDFTRYDNWTFGTFNHSYTPDGVLDMCWFMTRNLHDENYDVARRFGYGWATLDCQSLTKDGVLIKGINYFFPASGITIFGQVIDRPLNSSQATGASYPTVNVMAHEMSHYLFGTGHFTLNRIQLAPRRFDSYCTSLVGGWQSQYSGYEKWRLGWLTPTVIDYDADAVVLSDLVTTTDSTKTRLIKIPIPNSSQFFLVENRRWLSPFEARYAQASENPGLLKPGITVYLVVSESDYFTGTVVKKLDADGMSTWRLIYHGPTGDERDDWIDKDVSNPSDGYNETERIFIPGQPSNEFWQAEFLPYPTNPYGGGPYRGTYFLNTNTVSRDLDGDSLDTYQVGDVISPWSNPGSRYWDGSTATFSPTTIGIEVKSLDSVTQAYTLEIRTDDPYLLGPSKPQNLTAVAGPCGGTTMRWSQNSEPDVAGYNVYRGLFYQGSGEPIYTKINSTLISDTAFVDTSYESDVNLPQGIDLYHRYRVAAVDNQDKESVRSDFVDAYFTFLVVSPVAGNWNMTSVPNLLCDFSSGTVYPTASTPVYRFQCDTGYIQTNVLDNRHGWWIKFNSAQDITYSGSKIDSMAMPVNACWNIIGSISTALDTSEVTYSPNGIRNSNFFKYSGGYVLTGTLEPGQGYYVKSSQAGFFILKSGGSMMRINGGPSILDLDRFTIADAAGRKQDMYIRNGEGDVELPPDPPEGAFNVRFQSGNFVQSITPAQGLRSLPVVLRSLVYPITVSWNIKPENGVNYWLWRWTGANRERVAIRDSGSVTIARRIADVVDLEALAGEASNQPGKGVTSYDMDANSPNPFNPSTQIRFQLPEGSRVVLTVFDVIGRQVAELVNGYLESGYHTVTWNASNQASGVYFARFNVTDPLGNVKYTKISKLILMK